MTVESILNAIDEFAPFSTAMAWDNVGLLVGNRDSVVTSAVFALDVTASVIEYAKAVGSNLIISHHPVIFDGLKSLTDKDAAYLLIKNNISVISAHTNLDLCDDGVNDCLARALSLKNTKPFENEDNVGRIGELPEQMTSDEFAEHIKRSISSSCVKYVDLKKTIKTVAIVGGDGGDYYLQSRAADAYLTGEVKHHIYGYSLNAGIQLFTAGHYETEAVVLEPLAQKISEKCKITSYVYNNSDISVKCR